MRRPGNSILLWVTSFILFGLVPEVWSARESPKLTGTFSDLAYHDEAGDLLGTEIRIVRTREGYQAAVQIAEGSPSALYLTDATFRENQIAFTLKEAGQYSGGTFNGTIAPTGLTGSLKFPSGGEMKLNLKRGRSYWD